MLLLTIMLSDRFNAPSQVDAIHDPYVKNRSIDVCRGKKRSTRMWPMDAVAKDGFRGWYQLGIVGRHNPGLHCDRLTDEPPLAGRPKLVLLTRGS
jgi:hypothetical protein